MKISRIALTVLLAFFLILSTAFAQKEKETAPNADAVTQHSIKINGQTVSYTALTGYMPIRDDKGELDAHMFYIAYTKSGVSDLGSRPVLFSFNGGPGSSSVWMHMAFLGPRKVFYDEEGFALQPPYQLVDNEYSILDQADLVFIDPIGTGYSRMLPGKPEHKYHGVMEDIQSVAEFIRMYVSRNDRWVSPKFIIGESYGTTRASGLTAYLQSRHNMYINGTILVSTMNLGVQMGEDLEYMIIFPHYAATAWYHKALPPDLQNKPLKDVLEEAEKFSLTEYALALVQGNNLSPDALEETARKMSRLTGLKAEYIKDCNLRVNRTRFRKELLRDRGLTVGRLDSRYTGVDKEAAGDRHEYDPAMAHWSGAFTGALNSYLRNELKFETDLNYFIFGNVSPWRGMREARVGEMLRSAMTQNHYLKVMVLEGYYDGACDYFGAEYAFSHIDPAGSWKDRLRFRYYESGHMMYIRKVDLAKAKTDLVEFIDWATTK